MNLLHQIILDASFVKIIGNCLYKALKTGVIPVLLLQYIVYCCLDMKGLQIGFGME